MNTQRDTKSVSAETTFNADLTTLADIEPILWRLCEKVSARLKRAELAGQNVTLKLKDRDFRLTTRTRSGTDATQLAARLFAPARDMLREECDGRAFRLVGIGAGNLCEADIADRGDLADPGRGEAVRMEAAIDRIRDRFGAASVQKGLAFPFAQR